MSTDKNINVKQATEQQCADQVKETLQLLLEKEITTGVIMAKAGDRIIVLVAGKHHDIEEVISQAIENHARVEPDENETLEHFLTVGLWIVDRKQTAERVAKAIRLSGPRPGRKKPNLLQ